MSNRHQSQTRQIHPRALAELGEKACIVAIEVARDLRSGVIPPKNFEMHSLYGNAYCTAYCIYGHMQTRGANLPDYQSLVAAHPSMQLFHSRHPSDPVLAADAIERYVYLGSENPWSTR